MRVLVALVLALTAVAAVPTNLQRISDGTPTTIDTYPEIVALLLYWGAVGHRKACNGSILNNRSVLTAAHCTSNYTPAQWQSRVGSTYANSGGIVYATSQMINHPSHNIDSRSDADIAIIRISGTFTFSATVRAGSFASASYNLGDNEVVWAAGWGTLYSWGNPMEQLHHAQVWTVNQATCRTRYSELGLAITDNMLCSGWLDVGGRDFCNGDSGSPLYHNGVIVGVSFRQACGQARYPSVNTRVSRFASWISSNA